MTPAEARLLVEEAFQRLETAHDAIASAASGADVDALHRDFDQGERDHKLAVAQLERVNAVEEARANAPVNPVSETRPGNVRVGAEPRTYAKHNPEASFFRDLYRSQHLNDHAATSRLQRHTQEMDVDRRDLNSTDGTGGEFVPPLWLQEEFIALARAGRPFANTVKTLPLPGGTDSINFPSVASGTATATQADLGAVQETDATTSSVNVPVRTIAGQQDVSRQLLDRSIPGIDQILLADLAADYATKLDVQTISGSGSAPNARGILNVSGIISVTYTDGTPTVPELYPKLSDAIQQIHTLRFLSPSVIVMHPRRWAWFLAALDTANRPLITPYVPQNAVGQFERVAAENLVGGLHGLPVVVDPSIPTNLGSGTNEDRIIIARREDLYLFEEGEPNQATYFEVLSGNLAVRLQVFGYFAFSGERYPKSTAVISGTGLATPTF